ncbi:hypothetical protein ES703_106988 [subsurface metagenome]
MLRISNSSGTSIPITQFHPLFQQTISGFRERNFVSGVCSILDRSVEPRGLPPLLRGSRRSPLRTTSVFCCASSSIRLHSSSSFRRSSSRSCPSASSRFSFSFSALSCVSSSALRRHSFSASRRLLRMLITIIATTAAATANNTIKSNTTISIVLNSFHATVSLNVPIIKEVFAKQ